MKILLVAGSRAGNFKPCCWTNINLSAPRRAVNRV